MIFASVLAALGIFVFTRRTLEDETRRAPVAMMIAGASIALGTFGLVLVATNHGSLRGLSIAVGWLAGGLVLAIGSLTGRINTVVLTVAAALIAAATVNLTYLSPLGFLLLGATLGIFRHNRTPESHGV